MPVGSRASIIRNAEDNPELGHRTTPKPSSFSTPTPTPLMGNRHLDDGKRGTTNSKSSVMDSGSRKRPILAIRTVSPLVQQPIDNTSSTHPMKMRHGLDSVPKNGGGLRDLELGADTSLANGHRWKGKAKPDNLLQHETKETKRKRNEPTFSSKIKDILEWRTMKTGTCVHLERQENGDHGSATTTKRPNGSARDLWKSRHPKNKGPKAGQMYEIVNQHIIEDNIDRTVTISTWRERVEGYGSDTDNTSVYYFSPGGYGHEGAHLVEVNANLGRRRLGKHGSRPEIQGAQTQVKSGPSSTTKGRENFKGSQYNNIDSITTHSSRQKNTTLSASNKEKHTSSEAKLGGDRTDPSPWSFLTKLKVQDGPFMQRQQYYQESTPIEKELPPQPPFRPTRCGSSGSTISTIRSAPTTDFENFLDDCNPSLVHVSDVLRSLGIYKLEHLKAIARLSPEMRDREIKGVALGLGMTVVEWAILVDKIFQL